MTGVGKERIHLTLRLALVQTTNQRIREARRSVLGEMLGDLCSRSRVTGAVAGLGALCPKTTFRPDLQPLQSLVTMPMSRVLKSFFSPGYRAICTSYLTPGTAAAYEFSSCQSEQSDIAYRRNRNGKGHVSKGAVMWRSPVSRERATS